MSFSSVSDIISRFHTLLRITELSKSLEKSCFAFSALFHQDSRWSRKIGQILFQLCKASSTMHGRHNVLVLHHLGLWRIWTLHVQSQYFAALSTLCPKWLPIFLNSKQSKVNFRPSLSTAFNEWYRMLFNRTGNRFVTILPQKNFQTSKKEILFSLRREFFTLPRRLVNAGVVLDGL